MARTSVQSERAGERRVAREQNRFTRDGFFDYSLLFTVIFLICFGCLMIYSASAYESVVSGDDSTSYLKKQLFGVLVGCFAMALCAAADYRFWQRFISPIYFISLLSVVLVRTPLGIYSNGAYRWIDLKIASLQPAEFVKIAVILATAHLISQNSRHLDDTKTILRILLYGFLGAGFVAVVTSDLSSGIIIFGISAVMVFVASPKYKIFLGVAAGAAAAVAIFIGLSAVLSKSFRLNRILVWLNPEAYQNEGGYQVIQGLYAIGSGGLFGKGLGQSVQKLSSLPEAQNDFVFNVICEELGIVGAVAVIILFIFVIRRISVISASAPDLFGSMISTGVMAHIALQVVLNIAVVTNSIPNTGVTLPFISYGGTSVMCLMAEIGLVLSVSKRTGRESRRAGRRYQESYPE